ncbi:MAG: divergent PAP2 family protein [Oscillospiraceae bacterium]|nr:divergent PAP2 family protein [Oscillospiraceae bacterium]
MKDIYNYILLSAVISWCVAQFLKTMINLGKTKKFSAERLFGAGGWPSAHSAMVCSATAGIGRIEGITSTIFGVMCIVALITMYDAMGVRRAAGQHAREINKINHFLVDAEKQKQVKAQPKTLAEITSAAVETANTTIKDLKEYLGHTPFEVFSGAVLGVLLAFIIPISV